MMSLTATTIQERRRYTRGEAPPHVAISLVQSDGALAAESVNVSGGGLCLRLREMLEVRSLVHLQVTPEGSGTVRTRRPVRCTGRVTWVMQRLDLRDIPPFFFDTGIEFVDPTPTLRQLFARQGVALTAGRRPAGPKQKLSSATIRGRLYVPMLERTAAAPGRWHLVVQVDGVPCFSEHYASERTATAGWNSFRRRQGKR